MSLDDSGEGSRKVSLEIGDSNDVWAMDFMPDRLLDERPFQILTIVDCFTRAALSTAARTYYCAFQVVDELDRLYRLRGKPLSVRVVSVRFSPPC